MGRGELQMGVNEAARLKALRPKTHPSSSLRPELDTRKDTLGFRLKSCW